jgi:hypothetical protein
MGMEQSMQCLARETEVLGKEPSPMLLCPLWLDSGSNPGRRR